jgi:hypothetical protein
MDFSKEIVSWICHICRKEFNTISGGYAKDAKGVTCRSHLNIFGKYPRGEFQVVCDKCLTEGYNLGE